MNNDELAKILKNSNISDEQKKAMFDILNEKKVEVKKPKKEESKKEIVKSENLTKIDRPIVDQDYIYDKIPCNGDLFRIFYLANSNLLFNNNSNILGAFLIRWLNIGCAKYALQKGKFLKADEYVIKLNPKLKFAEPYEQEIYKIIKKACDGDNTLTSEEFRRYSEKRGLEIQSLLDEICEVEEKKIIESKLMKKEVKTYQETSVDNNNPLNTNGTIKTYVSTTIINSEKLNEEIKNIIGFKHYIKSLNKDDSVKLPKEYYEICELLGITNYISRRFNKDYPEFYFRHLQYLYHIRSNFYAPTSAMKK